MTKDELKQQYIKWAERCGVADKLGSDLDRKADDALKNVTAHILDTTSEATIEKTTISSVLLSRFAIEWGEKSLDINAALFALCCSEILYQMQSEKDARIAELESELAALKEKYRWRKQSEEPHQTLHEGEYIEAIVRLNTYVLSQRPFVLKCWKDGYTFPSEEVGADSILYWRPLDLPNLPEEETK